MAATATARETLCSLRRQIARIEGRLAERLGPAGAAGDIVLRSGGARDLLSIGDSGLDAALGGGLPLAALTEIHGRDAGALAGFTLALAGLAVAADASALRRPLLWIGAGNAMRESGAPYLAGTMHLAGISPSDMLIARPERLADALWMADEAAALSGLAVVVLEVHGKAPRLDLTATRRLHRRAREAGRPVFLLRAFARAEPTAAPFRILVSSAPSAPRQTLEGPLDGSIGRPAFVVSIDKAQTAAPAGQFIVEWNSYDRRFEQRHQDTRALVPASGDRPHRPAAPGSLVAFRPSAGAAAAGAQQPGGERPAHFGARRAG